MIYEVQTYDATDNTVYYETVEDAIDYEDARDVIAEKYPNRKVISVQEKNNVAMTDLPIDNEVLEDWLGGPVPEEKLKEIRESTMKYLISYYYKNDLEKRYKEYDSMNLAIACANLLIARGDYVVDSITTQYS